MKYRFLPIITAAASVALIISNILAIKLVRIFGLTVNGATCIYPITFILADIIAEVYGYASARRVIWTAFAIQIAVVFCIMWVLWLPSALPAQAAPFQTALSLSFWIVLGSLCGYWAGDFFNSIIMSRLKVITNKRHLWLRTISSTIFGQAIDTVLFVNIAFGIGSQVSGHSLPLSVLWALVWGVYVLKVAVEIVLTPLVYGVVTWLKHSENVDALDKGINYSPFVGESA